MNSRLLPFLCGGVVGAAAASAAWSLSSGPAPEPVPEIAKPVPVEEATEPAPVTEPVPVAESAPETAEPVPVVEPAPVASGAPVTEPVPVPAEPVPAAERPQRRGPPRWEEMTDEQREEMRQRFRKMHDEHATRVVESFVERNGLEPADGERLFAVVDSMNERVLARVQLWTDYVQVEGGERMSRDQGARMMRDLLDDLVKGYEDLDESFGTEWREKSPDFDLGQMVDPEVWGSLFRLGGAMGGPGGPGGFGGRGPRGPGGRGGPRRGGGNGGGNAP